MFQREQFYLEFGEIAGLTKYILNKHFHSFSHHRPEPVDNYFHSRAYNNFKQRQ